MIEEWKLEELYVKRKRQKKEDCKWHEKSGVSSLCFSLQCLICRLSPRRLEESQENITVKVKAIPVTGRGGL
jgi:hypothetical protein